MSTARLRSLRLVGFKSFAERTVVEFGPGISAIVGPNGSGKSNLADALRWVLGEQGRTLRTRRAEDLIYAGSSTRRALGMADVTVILDNEDRLLPVDFAEVELGRRLFRNGENEFLLNRQRIFTGRQQSLIFCRQLHAHLINSLSQTNRIARQRLLEFGNAGE